MSFDLGSVKKTKSDLPPRTLIYGDHGIGKSTFGAMAPSPIFIQTEDGLGQMDVDAFPLATKLSDVSDALCSLYEHDHGYKTLVIDSLDWLEKLIFMDVLKDKFEQKADEKGIEDIGYGKGYVFAGEKFYKILEALQAVRMEKKMHVVLICHAEIKKFEDPLADTYDRYQLKLCKQIAKAALEWCDDVCFASLATATTKAGKKDFDGERRSRAIGTGQRVLTFDPSPSFTAKRRSKVPGQINLDWNEYQATIKS